VEASDIEVTENLIPLLSQPTRVELRILSTLAHRRDNDLESTRGSYTTVEGGVAASWFGSKPTSAGCWSRTPPIALSFAITARDKASSLPVPPPLAVENPLGSTVLLDPAQTPTAAEL